MEPETSSPDLQTELLKECPVCFTSSVRSMPIPAVTIGDEHFARVLPDLDLVKCHQCGLIYINPRPTPACLRAYYERPGYAMHCPRHGKEHNYGRLRLLSSFSTASRLLDVGCGGGAFLTSAREIGYSVAGIEPSSLGRKSATENGLEVYQDCAGPLSEQRHFDVVTVWHVLEHVSEIHSFLHDIKSLLVPGGVLIVAVPNASSARARLLRAFPRLRPPGDEAYRAFPIHLYAFSRRNLSILMKNSGFSVVSTTTQYLALDECFARNKQSVPPVENPGPATQVPSETTKYRPARWKRLFSPLKRAFFAAHLGESLVAVATPPQSSSPRF